MRRFLSVLALFSIMTVLFACGGGGGDSTPAVTDTTAPAVTAFAMPATATSLTVAVTTFTATDATGVTGYMITASATAPTAAAAGWTAAAPTTFTFAAAGSQTAYAWAKDAAGNVSAGTATATAAVTITLPAGTVAAAVQGVVTDPSSATDAPLVGATVNAYVQPAGTAKIVDATVVVTTTTGADGSYSITGLAVGTNYYFEFVLTGYVTFTHYNVHPETTVRNLERVRPIPNAWQTQNVTVSGKVKNASTNAGLPNMTVKIRPGANNNAGSTITSTVTTDSAGTYSASLAAGTYTAEVTGSIGTTAIITKYQTIDSFVGNTAAQDIAVTAPLSTTGTGQYRIVLDWGNNPSDLDSHLTGPTATSGTRFHTAYYAYDYPAGSTTTGSTGFRIAGSTTEAFLDVDNTDHGYDNGPETTTIAVPRTGIYRFYVHHFYGTSTISASGAQVNVYKGNALLATFNPPASTLGNDAVWSVFTMDVTSSGETIAAVNTISMIESRTLAKTVDTGFEEYYLFEYLPIK
jgi:hypothetical protein